MLTLSIKKQWYDMLVSGEKKEEYREIKPYYTKRFQKIVAPYYLDENDFWQRMWLEECHIVGWYEDELFDVKFRNGYSANAPEFKAKVCLSVGKGKPEWGAEKDKEYYILTIKEIYK